jgi:hypothetical protein
MVRCRACSTNIRVPAAAPKPAPAANPGAATQADQSQQTKKAS